MAFLRKIFGPFGPSKVEVWRQFAEEIGAEFVDGRFWRAGEVVARVGHWTITLDTYASQELGTTDDWTRLRARYVNKDGFRFTIYPRGLFSDLGKALGMQDVEVGYPRFDRKLIIKGSDESKLRALLANPRIHELILDLIPSQPSIRLEVRDREGWFRKGFPKGVYELHLVVNGIIKDIERLKSLYELFALTLSHLRHMGSASEDDPKIGL